jgi:hypothetical protein
MVLLLLEKQALSTVCKKKMNGKERIEERGKRKELRKEDKRGRGKKRKEQRRIDYFFFL